MLPSAFRVAAAANRNQTALPGQTLPWLLLVIALAAGGLRVSPGFGQPPRVSTGLPDNVEQYKTQRDRLVSADAARRFDAEIELDVNERRLDARLTELRNALLGEYKTKKHFPPSQPFYNVKDDIRKTKLFKLLREMPKGGVLHLHTSSTAPARWIVETGILEPGCYVCWPDDAGQALRGQLGFFAADRVPRGYQSVKQVLAREPDFADKLLPLISFNRADDRLNNLEIWTRFDEIFQRVGGLVSYRPVFEKYYEAAFQTLLDDNVTYVELRAGMGGLYDTSGRQWDYKEAPKLLWKVRNRIRESRPEFDLKLICSGHRWSPSKEVWTRLEEAVELRREWKEHNFVVGFDLVGEEDAGHTTEFFLADWIKLKSYLRERGSTLPLYFHDGESGWPGDENLYDAFLLGSRRIGHGLNLFRFPTLERGLREQRVAVEVCPISNQELRYVSDLRMHPAVGYMARGVPCVLGNDDPGILGNDGLSFDFWEAVVAWKLDLRSLKQLSLNSLVYSAMTDAEKSAAVARWQASWSGWVERSSRSLP